MEQPKCPRCGKPASHSTVMFDMGNAQCDPCRIIWKYWEDTQRPATGTVKEIA